jgi:hypothetical protein
VVVICDQLLPVENVGFSAQEITGILGANWLRFMFAGFAPTGESATAIEGDESRASGASKPQ